MMIAFFIVSKRKQRPLVNYDMKQSGRISIVGQSFCIYTIKEERCGKQMEGSSDQGMTCVGQPCTGISRCCHRQYENYGQRKLLKQLYRAFQ